MNKDLLITVITIILFFIVGSYLIDNKNTDIDKLKQQNDSIQIINDSLFNQNLRLLDSIKIYSEQFDSVQYRIDSLNFVNDSIQNSFNNKIRTIKNQSMSEDYQDILNYLNQYEL